MSDAPKADPSIAYENLRRESAALLGFDLGGDLTALQQMQIDVASIVRMEIDTAQGAQLAGKEIDIGRLSVCVTMLGKLLPQRALEAEASKPDSAGDARAKLAALLDNQAAALEHDDERRWAEDCERESEVEAADWRGDVRPPAPALPKPAHPTRTSYIDHAVLAEPAPVLAPPVAAAQPSSDVEWARWYRSGGGEGSSRNIHGIPRDW